MKNVLDFVKEKLRIEGIKPKDEVVYEEGDDKGVLQYNEDKISMFNKAKKHKVLLFGQEKKWPDTGYDTDRTMFEYIIAAYPKRFVGQDTLTNLKIYHDLLYPYLKNLLKEYRGLQDYTHNLIMDQDQVLKDYANQNLELRIYKEWMDVQHLGVSGKFKRFEKIKKKEVEDKILKIQKEHEEKNEKRDKKKS